MAGRITDWNDDKGFGFVLPNGGGVRAFVHINEFQRASRRPVAGDLISYLPSVDARGRTNARQVRHAGQLIEKPRTPSRVPRAALGICALAAGVAACAAGVLPPLLLAAYLALSVLSYLMYRSDKLAARRDAQRTPEARLHLVDLLGGWPGALIAQQRYRHKTAKQSFQLTFWATVVFNLAGAACIIG
ncbi:cold shock and DUF1294 domain-containing protein [Luteimonas sp. MC1782]|uniref:DUF1294 domain-containing protein n=1 Tax=Luteimonas sp. MC1782 TaxID=2760305 RepID=UPI001602ED80|nr:cold shock and DUF1294 domain-containing protein [Luteimonas sp. MC1782]MBB1473063.1 cold shock and DUF1294 domain-containing protein [Luteimonas sp. MC1782]